MRLYELTADYTNAIEAYSHAETQDELDAIAKHLDSISIPLKNKALAIAKMVINAESEQTAINSEIDRLSKHLKQRSSMIDWLKKYLSNNLLAAEIMVVEEPGLKISFRKSERVEIVNEQEIPKDYIKTKVETSVDKNAVKDALKIGVNVAGAKLVSCQNIQIK